MNVNKRTLKRTLVTVIIGASVLFGVNGQLAKNEAEAQAKEAKQAQLEAQANLEDYRVTYDNLTIYEDGSWTYDEGVEPYYFWNPEWKAEHPAVASTTVGE